MNSRLIEYIKSKNQILLSDEQVQQAIEKIKKDKLAGGFGTYFQHRKNVQHHLHEKAKQPLCPLCQSAMIKRTAKNGDYANQEFWGCSRYPKCRGIRGL